MTIEDRLTEQGFQIDLPLCSESTLFYSKDSLFVEIADDGAIVGAKAKLI